MCVIANAYRSNAMESFYTLNYLVCYEHEEKREEKKRIEDLELIWCRSVFYVLVIRI